MERSEEAGLTSLCSTLFIGVLHHQASQRKPMQSGPSLLLSSHGMHPPSAVPATIDGCACQHCGHLQQQEQQLLVHHGPSALRRRVRSWRGFILTAMPLAVTFLCGSAPGKKLD